MSTSWAKGSTSAWRKIRASVLADNLEHNEGRCQLAVPDHCTGTADCVHHTLGRAITGDDRRYLIAACTPCNSHIGNPTRNSPPHKRISSWRTGKFTTPGP